MKFIKVNILKKYAHSLITLLILCFGGFAEAQVERTSDLFKQIKANDSMIFQIGFNQCMVDPFERLLAEELIFYHDKSGITDSKQKFIDGLKNGLCANPKTYKSRRELVDDKMEVFPLYNNGDIYGAIQIGEHFFYEKRGDSPEKKVGLAKFTNTWVMKDGIWKLSNVLSYDHKGVSDLRKTVIVPNEILTDYIGTYAAPNSGKVTISICDEGIMLHTEKMSSCLPAISENTFFHKEAPLTFTFLKDDLGKVSKMVVREKDKIVEEAIKQSIIKTKRK